jgi:hypothetical protein
MSAASSNSSSGGLGFFGALFLLFLGLKLTNVIDWSWWWVTMPLWFSFAFVFGILAIMGVFALIVVWLEGRR